MANDFCAGDDRERKGRGGREVVEMEEIVGAVKFQPLPKIKRSRAVVGGEGEGGDAFDLCLGLVFGVEAATVKPVNQDAPNQWVGMCRKTMAVDCSFGTVPCPQTTDY